jgi:hypothetical protein
LKFIHVLELVQNLEYNFFQAMLYLVHFISESDISCFNLFYIYLKIKDLRTTTINLLKVSTINSIVLLFDKVK